MTVQPGYRIAFIHPDLGIGGAERLVVDAAVQLRARGHVTAVYTAHHDPHRCSPETADGTLDVRIRGDWFPPSIGGRLLAPCAVARTCLAAAAAVRAKPAWDVFFCDLVSHCIPVLRRADAPVIFYCHFPDRLLARRSEVLRRLYRLPIDRAEEVTTGMADRVLVNSEFTASVFARTFRSLDGVEPEVLYPAVDVERYRNIPPVTEEADGEIVVLSINRFERKKNLGLAVRALAALRNRIPGAIWERVRLILAGGYDERLADNRKTIAGLETEVAELGLPGRVDFEFSISERRKLALLQRARCIVYTPAREHFGYGPLEAMAAGRPVVAADSGGPLESVVDGETGFLCEPTAPAFAEAIGRLVTDPALSRKCGTAGHRHVERHFSLDTFGQRLDRIVRRTLAGKDKTTGRNARRFAPSARIGHD